MARDFLDRKAASQRQRLEVHAKRGGKTTGFERAHSGADLERAALHLGHDRLTVTTGVSAATRLASWWVSRAAMTGSMAL
jgi:hypothetical protein